MAVFWMESSYRGSEPVLTMWEGPDEEFLLEEMRWAARGVDGKVRILDRDGNELETT